MNHNGEMREIIKSAEDQGWRYQETNGGHHKFLAPDGVTTVITSKTPSAPSQRDNFLADMRRAGFKEQFTMEKPYLPNGGGKLTVKQYVLDLLSRHPEGCFRQDIASYVCSARPELSKNAVDNALYLLRNSNIVEQTNVGKYFLKPIDRPQLIQLPVPIDLKMDDATPDVDMKILDDALIWLSQIEAVIQRNKIVLIQLAQLKKLLGGGK